MQCSSLSYAPFIGIIFISQYFVTCDRYILTLCNFTHVFIPIISYLYNQNEKLQHNNLFFLEDNFS